MHEEACARARRWTWVKELKDSPRDVPSKVASEMLGLRSSWLLSVCGRYMVREWYCNETATCSPRRRPMSWLSAWGRKPCERRGHWGLAREGARELAGERARDGSMREGLPLGLGGGAEGLAEGACPARWRARCSD